MSSSLRRQRFKDGRRHSLNEICLGTSITHSSSHVMPGAQHGRMERDGPCLRPVRRLLHHRPRLCRPSLANFHARHEGTPFSTSAPQIQTATELPQLPLSPVQYYPSPAIARAMMWKGAVEQRRPRACILCRNHPLLK